MKNHTYWSISLAIWLGISSLSCAQNKNTITLADDEKLIEFTTNRFTLPNLYVTPDGKTIIFDVLGDIYQVPIEGGKAEVVLQDNHWKRAGKLSPDRKTIAYISDETGEFQVWTMDLVTQEKKVYPIKEYVHYPLNVYWRDNYQLLIPSDEGLQSANILTGDIELVRPLKTEEKNIMQTVSRKMTVNKTATHVYYQLGGALWAYDIKEKSDKYVGKIDEYRNKTLFSANPNGDTVLYFINSKIDLMEIELKLWNLETNNTQCLFKTNDLGFSTNADYSFDFIDNNTIILDKEGTIVSMDIETGQYSPIPIKVEIKKVIKKPLRREPQYISDSIITASVLRNPITRKDMDTIYFGAFGKLHSYAKETGVTTEIYPKEDRFEVSPSLSPDGKYLAYTTWNDREMGHLYIRELHTGREYQLTKTSGRYINPAWSPDGTEIVFIADETETKIGIPRQSGGSNFNNYQMDLLRVNVLKKNEIQECTVSNTIYRIFPFSQLPRRFYPIPVYHSNGENIFITTRNHEKNLPVLLEINLKTKEVLHETLIPFHTDEVIIAPNGQQVAFIFDEQVWVDSFPHTLKLELSASSKYASKKSLYKAGVVNNIMLPKAKSVYEVAPSYLYWQDEHTLMWGSAEEVYTYDVRTGRTEKIAEIKVQKQRAVSKAQYALTNARIITMNKQNEIIEKGTILVKDNRIEAVGKVMEIIIPKNYKIFDLEGKTIMPGLIDVHAHYHHFPHEFQVQQNYKYIGNLAYGVTTIYDPSVNVLDYREQAQRVETGLLIGPRIFASGNIIDEYITDYDYRCIKNKVDTDRIFKSNLKLGVSGPLKQYNRKNRIHRKWLYKSAKEIKMTITNHDSNFILAMTQIIDGYTAMEHEKYTFPIQKDIVQLIAQSGINYTPTFIVSPGINKIFAKKTDKEKNKLLRLNGSIVYNKNYKSNYENADSENEIFMENLLKMEGKEQTRATKALQNILNANGTISTGGHGNPLPGIGTHWELWFMSKGMSNYQALQTATINGAEKLDLQEEIGSIEENKLVDIIVLNENPLKNIYCTIDINSIIQNGSIYDPVTMKKTYPIERK